MIRRAFLYGVAASVLTACADGCGDDSVTNPDVDPTPEGGTPPPDPGAPPSKRAPSPIGYSNVGSLNAEEARAILAAGLTLVQAEAIPFGRDWSAFDIRRLRGIADAVRAASATLLITLVNANGAVQLRQTDSFFRSKVRQIAAEVGVAQVWFEGVSEPWTAADRSTAVRWQRIALEEWGGTSVTNGNDVRGDILDIHHCNYPGLLNGLRNSGDLHSTDCTPVLASNLGEARVREATRLAVERRRRFICYDTTNRGGANMDVVRWMAESL